MNDEPLGDFELTCESRERRAFRPSKEGGTALSWAQALAASAMEHASRQRRDRIIEILRRAA
jgi:hypothetical protein